VTDEEMEKIVDKITERMFNIVSSFAWFAAAAASMDDNDTARPPTYEEAIAGEVTVW
jgi:hypothetical protein